MRPLRLSLFIFAMLLSGCGKHQPAYQAFTVSVLDEKTLASIAGAKILTPCMGMSPYRTNIYFTDESGKARVMYYTGFLAVSVSAPGYSNSTVAFTTNEIALVKLKRPRKL